MVRVISWNVNGIRTLRPSLKEALDALNADIICLQETKVQSNADESVCLVPGYHSFFSFCRTRAGYSGTATFTRIPQACSRTCVTPVDAGEGLDNNVGGANPNWLAHVAKSSGDKLENHEERSQPPELTLEDVAQVYSEGRVVITDHAHFVCINIYAPAVSVEKRARFKFAFNRALELKVRALRSSGRRVLVAGDFNIAPAPEDVAEKVRSAAEFGARPSRAWLRGTMLGELGMVDSFREMNPHVRDAYSCWSEATRARETNFGVRIDLMVVDRQFYDECVQGVGLLCDVHGSDHCPASLDIRDDLFREAGLPDRVGAAREPPRFCTKFYKRFNAKQSTMSSFLSKPCSSDSTSQRRDGLNTQSRGIHRASGGQVKVVGTTPQIKKRAPQKTNRQLSIGTFFAPRAIPQPPENPETSGSDAVQPPSCVSEPKESEVKNANDSENTKKWQQLLSGPPPPPMCRHGEPCLLKSVKKSGENKGRTFFSCSRPAGQWPSDRSASCNYFVWAHVRASYKASNMPRHT